MTHNGNVVTITRKTSDGIWQLKQTLTNVPANATGPASVKVAMALKNLSSIQRSVYLMRYSVVVNADKNGGLQPLDFDYTAETAYGLIPNFGRGLSTTNNTFDFSHLAFFQNQPGGPIPCFALNEIGVQPGFNALSIMQFWTTAVPAHATKSVMSTYKPI